LSQPDRELVARFLERGEEEAFRVLFRRHTPRLYAFALRLMGGRASDAEDVVQETWMRAARRLGDFRWQAALTTWLLAIAANCARERWRSTGISTDELEGQEPAAPAGQPASRIDLDRAIALLTNRQRLILILHDIEGWTHAEIAAQLDIETGTSKSTLFHARRAVRARLTASPGVSHD